METRGAMEEDATTEGIEGESEKTQICHSHIDLSLFESAAGTEHMLYVN